MQVTLVLDHKSEVTPRCRRWSSSYILTRPDKDPSGLSRIPSILAIKDGRKILTPLQKARSLTYVSSTTFT